MSAFHKFKYKNSSLVNELSSAEKFSVYYHNIFEYPLTFSELVRWTPSYDKSINVKVESKNDYYFISGREGLIYKRLIKQRYSNKKIELAKKASKVLAKIPSIKMIGVTGSLAMNNASKNSDIDLVIITKMGTLWTTRLVTYIILKILNFPIRVPGSLVEKDMFCLNMWMDESNLEWGKTKRNFYTAHEILQVVPLFNRGNIYSLFLHKNRWALNFWPNVMEIPKVDLDNNQIKKIKIGWVEELSYKFQLRYMKGKITKEIISPTRAIFHPNDLSKKILQKTLLTTGTSIG